MFTESTGLILIPVSLFTLRFDGANRKNNDIYFISLAPLTFATYDTLLEKVAVYGAFWTFICMINTGCIRAKYPCEHGFLAYCLRKLRLKMHKIPCFAGADSI